MEGSSGAGESASQHSDQDSNSCLGLAAEQAAISCSSTPRAESSPFSAQKGYFGPGQFGAVRYVSDV